MARPSLRQKRVAKLIVENAALDKPLTHGEIVEASGYGASMKKNSHVVVDSDGVKKALEDMGFTEHNANIVVAEILMNKEERSETRLNAAKEVYKIHGSYAPEKSTTTNVNVNIDMKPEEQAALLALLNDK